MGLNILLHDFAGHPFQAGLSRELARRGHRVTHAWFAADQGPKGLMCRQPGDPSTLQFQPLGATIPYSKTNFVKRRAGDRAYGRALSELVAGLRPDVVLSGNTPTEAQEPLQARCRHLNIRFVYWCQDFYSLAVSELLARRFPGPGHLIGAWYRYLERRQMRRADRVILITGGFSARTRAWGISDHKTRVIPNWGSLADIDILPRQNPWTRALGLSAATRFLYSGTLAMKHNPTLLEALGKALAGGEELIVVSAGVGMDRLRQRAVYPGLPHTRLLPLQRFQDLPQVLAAGDVLLAMVERDAGKYSVPSKILSYLCAGRPVVLAAPPDNLAAHILAETGAGLVVDPEDSAGFVAAALSFRDDPAQAARAGAAGRAYAEQNFDLPRIAGRFEKLLSGACLTAGR